jgi:2-keto-4-pentenoate hydratase
MRGAAASGWPELPEAIRPKTLAEGYDVQDALVGEIGTRAEGWKLGVGSRSGMRAANIDRPLVGRVVAPRVHRSGDTGRDPQHGSGHHRVRDRRSCWDATSRPAMHRPIPCPPVERMHVTFELVLSRFFDRRAVGWPSFVADLGGFGALVVGDPITDIEGVTKTVAVSVDGKEVARGMTGDDLTYPVTAFGYLVAHARDRGITLRRGEIATLGAIGRPFDLAADAEVIARYLGSQLRFRLQLPKE